MPRRLRVFGPVVALALVATAWWLTFGDGVDHSPANPEPIPGSVNRASSPPERCRQSTARLGATLGVMLASCAPASTFLPALGWDHWNHFGGRASEKLVRQVADAMHSNGMQAAGYRYIVVDDSWASRRDAHGTLTSDPKRYPSGMKALGNYAHQRGFLFGIYTSPNYRTCAGRPGSAGHAQQDVNTFASWRVDYIKLDWCGADYSTSGAAAIAQQWQDAIGASGRSMYLSINAGGGPSVAPWGSRIVTSWRSGDDICAGWYNHTRPHDPAARDCYNQRYHFGIYDYLYSSNEPADISYQRPNHYADPDMLEVGNPGLNFDEARSHFSLWAMWSAPLIAGNDPRAMNGADLASLVLLNREVIAIDQDTNTALAARVSDNRGAQVWVKPLASGQKALLFLNASDNPADISLDLGAQGMSGRQFRDLWTHATLGPQYGTYTASRIAAHASVMLLAS